MLSQAGVESYSSQNVPLVSPLYHQAIERYEDQPSMFLSRGDCFANRGMDDFYEQRQPSRDFTAQLNTLHRYYTILDDDHALIRLLEAEPDLYFLLIEAVEPLRQAFGEKALLYMRIQSGDEDSLLKVAVWLSANFSNDPERAIQAFDEEWWLHNCHRSSGGLVFDYEMQNAV